MKCEIDKSSDKGQWHHLVTWEGDDHSLTSGPLFLFCRPKKRKEKCVAVACFGGSIRSRKIDKNLRYIPSTVSSAISLSRSPTIFVPTHTYFPASLFRAFVIINFPPRICESRREGDRLCMERKMAILVWETLGTCCWHTENSKAQTLGNISWLHSRIPASIYAPKAHYNTVIKCTHKHIMAWWERGFSLGFCFELTETQSNRMTLVFSCFMLFAVILNLTLSHYQLTCFSPS